MANKDPSKTEKATPKRVTKARNEGNVLTSPDVSSMIMILIGTALLFMLTPTIRDGFKVALMQGMDIDCRQDWNEESLTAGGNFAMIMLMQILGPSVTILTIFGIISMRLQVGKYFSVQTLKWKFDFINPKRGLMSLMPNKQNFVNLGLTIGKVILIGGLVYVSIKSKMDAIKELGTLPIHESIEWMSLECLFLVLKIMALFIFIAIADYAFKRKKYFDDLKMSKQEVKDERRNSEGDPMIKGKIRSKMRELLRGQMMRQVPDADVIVTNPTHVAVAIKYEIGSFAPMVVAKGLRKRAERIKLIARQYDIPIIEAPPLARSLYRNIKVNTFITADFYTPVAAILARIHRSGRKFRQYKPPEAVIKRQEAAKARAERKAKLSG